jgi:hypothetical protein
VYLLGFRLHIVDCGLSDAGIAAIGEAIKTNKTIISLFLSSVSFVIITRIEQVLRSWNGLSC